MIVNLRTEHLALSLALPLVMATVAASAFGQEARFFRTSDGSPFLLVPVEHHSINWVNLQPSGPGVEQRGRQGLGLAMARASLLGGTEFGPTQEPPLSWEKALRRTPSSGSRIVQIEGHVGIAVTFDKRSLQRVAHLLRVRTRRHSLLGVAQLLKEVQGARGARLQAAPHLGMLQRTLAAFDTTAKPLLSALAVHKPAEIGRSESGEFYRVTYSPERSLNVITGDLDLVETERQLKSIFAGSGKGTPGTGGPNGPRMVGAKAKPDAPDTLMLGCPIPADLDTNAVVTLDLLVEYLAGDAHAYLPDHLRATGHPRVQVHVRAPFPSTGGIFLIAVTEPGSILKEDNNLTVHLEQALAKLATDLPDEDRLDRAVAALRAARSAALRQPEGLATLLARRWARTGKPPIQGLAEESRVSLAEFRALAKRVFALASQTLVLPKLPK